MSRNIFLALVLMMNLAHASAFKMEGEESVDPLASIRSVLKYWKNLYDTYYEEIHLGYCWADYFLGLKNEALGIPMTTVTNDSRTTSMIEELANSTQENANILKEILKCKENNEKTQSVAEFENSEGYGRQKRSYEQSNWSSGKNVNPDEHQYYKINIRSVPSRINDKRRIEDKTYGDSHTTKQLDEFIFSGTRSDARNDRPKPRTKRSKARSASRFVTDFQMDSSLPGAPSDKRNLAHSFRSRPSVLQPTIRKAVSDPQPNQNVGGHDREKISRSKDSAEYVPRKSFYRVSIYETPHEDSFEDSSSVHDPISPELSREYQTVSYGYGSGARAKNSGFVAPEVPSALGIGRNVDCSEPNSSMRDIEKNMRRKVLYRKGYGLFRVGNGGGQELRSSENSRRVDELQKHVDVTLVSPRKDKARSSRASKSAKRDTENGADSKVRRRRATRDVLEFAPFDIAFFKDSKGWDWAEMAAVSSARGVKDGRFMADYGGSGNETGENPWRIVSSPPGGRGRRSTDVIPKRGPASILSPLARSPIIMSVLRTLGLLIYAGRQIMDLIESTEVLSCTGQYLSNKILKWIDS